MSQSKSDKVTLQAGERLQIVKAFFVPQVTAENGRTVCMVNTTGWDNGTSFCVLNLGVSESCAINLSFGNEERFIFNVKGINAIHLVGMLSQANAASSVGENLSDTREEDEADLPHTK